MRILAKTCLILAMCFLAAGSAMAGTGLKRPVGRSSLGARTIQRAKAVEMLRSLAASGYDPYAQSTEEEEKEDEELEPFVALSVPSKPLHLGEVCGPNLREVAARFNARVVANCPYHISASFDGLRHQGDDIAISSKHMTVKINGRQVAVGTGRVPIAAQGPTPRGGVDVPVELQVGVKAMAAYPAGRYNGTLVITITAGH